MMEAARGRKQVEKVAGEGAGEGVREGGTAHEPAELLQQQVVDKSPARALPPLPTHLMAV